MLSAAPLMPSSFLPELTKSLVIRSEPKYHSVEKTDAMRVASYSLIIVTAAFAYLGSCADSERAKEGDLRTIDGVGDFRLGPDSEWVGTTQFEGKPVEVELRHYDSSFDQIAEFAKQVFGESGVNSKNLSETIDRGLTLLQWRFDEYDPVRQFSADEFRPKSFYLHWNSDYQKFGMIILLEHNSDKGRWVIDSYRIGGGTLIWSAHEKPAPNKAE